MNALVFYYKWPLIKEDLIIHIDPPSEYRISWGKLTWMMRSIPNRDNWIHVGGQWYTRVKDAYGEIPADKVPKEIRLRALILT